MSEQVKKLVPKLRFPEYVDSEGWAVTTLNKLASRVTLRNKNAIVSRVFTNSAVDGVVDQRDYFDKDIANQNNLENYFIVDKGCYVYNPRISNTAPVGPISKNKIGKGVMSPLYTVFKFHSAENDFYEQFFKTDNWYSYLRNISNSGARHDRMSISNDAFMEMPLPQTNPKEQQKIADFLSALDDLITAQNQKVEALKQHKKGLMQQLFPAKGETVPQLRFAEFENTGSWSLKVLSTFIKERSTLANQELPLYSLTIENGVTPKSERYERAFLVKDEAEAYKVVEANDFAFNPMNLRFGAIARYTGSQKVALSKYYNIFYCDSTVDSRFCEAYFKSEYMVSVYDDIATGSLIEKRRVHFSEFLKLNLRFPELKEQQKIADLLTSADNLISAQTQKIEALKAHKKGLMQQLFPTINEV